MIRNNKILTEVQKQIIYNLPNKLKQQYAMGGGTALSAFYLKHRISDDLDFFALEGEGLRKSIIYSLLLQQKFNIVKHEKIYDRAIFFIKLDNEIVKIEFGSTYFQRINNPQKIENTIFVESLHDIISNKLIAMTDRYDIKDFIDIYFTWKLKNIHFADMIMLAEKKYKANYKYLINFDKVVQLPEQQLLQISNQLNIQHLDIKEFKQFYTNVKEFFIQEDLKYYNESHNGPSC